MSAKASDIDVICDESYKNHVEIPSKVLQMENLKMLYLDGNMITNLPEDFFHKLPKLYWLDLRGNQLQSIPSGVANHASLENVLLQNNKIEMLPNELGLVPNLKVLQLSGNPLIYPPQSVVEMGVDDVCIFLKQEYYKENPTPKQIPSRSSDSAAQRESKSSKLCIKTMPVVSVKSLSKEILDLRQVKKDNTCSKNQKIHRITKSASKMSVHSQYNSDRSIGLKVNMSYEERVQENELKQVWLEKLKDLIRDQQKIIEQEKSVGALSKWRQSKRSEPARSVNCLDAIVTAPFDTEPEYNKLMSRSDHTEGIEKLISSRRRRLQRRDDVDVDTLINEVVSKLRGMEVKLQQDTSATQKLMNAEREIKMIVDLHKRIADIQTANDIM
ncbi:PREDICTED: leucine-rich repeat-containing protein 27-like [Nicrophorus vespilloides]|uniref:Leucine-rich repeat-containing protein 27-like n=1 Tax=Nicrophorus vespilloides TaxID=110193 RepID=A0ABM1M6U5_NICVS|nr:PREDICTED: leucine-rich repeat-containing protein 27-like [Nicrophorus vespilloides]